jgi:hypothetical protein
VSEGVVEVVDCGTLAALRKRAPEELDTVGDR